MSLAALEAAKAAKEFAKIRADHHLSADELGANSDAFIATTTAETFNGGAGKDLVSYHKSMAGVTVDLFTAGAETGGFAAGDQLNSVEHIIGSAYRDYLVGTSAANTFVGLGGADTLIGGGGADRLYGDGGTDTLIATGTAGVTTFLDGGADQDTLFFTTNGGRAEITTGTGTDLTQISITDARDFHVVITDFQPYWESQHGYVTDQEALNGDRLQLRFKAGTGMTDADMADFQQIISGDDLILHYDNPYVHGDIVLQDIGQWLDLGVNDGYTFSLDVAFASPRPMPV